jgi:acyl-CoA hydrolase
MVEQEGKYVHQSATEMVQLVLPNDTNMLGNVLGGRVMHWIDLVGAMVAFRHSRRPVVTASMERLDFHSPIKLGDLVILKACLTYVGKTSMEVQVEVYSEEPLTGSRRHTSSAFLTYVALDDQGKPIPAPPLLLTTEEEKQRHRDAEVRRQQRLSTKRHPKGSHY